MNFCYVYKFPYSKNQSKAQHTTGSFQPTTSQPFEMDIVDIRSANGTTNKIHKWFMCCAVNDFVSNLKNLKGKTNEMIIHQKKLKFILKKLYNLDNTLSLPIDLFLKLTSQDRFK